MLWGMTAEVVANRYRVLGPLGLGAMGEVLLVEDLGERGEKRALKRLHGKAPAGADWALREEFRRQSAMQHPNCCQALAFGEDAEGQPWMVMELVEGYGLEEAPPLSPQELRAIFGQLALALGYLHRLGFVYRDLKAANVRVRPDGVVKLMDFGLIDFALREEAEVAGTLGYLAPEAIRREPLDGRSDLYALGALLYELLAGRLPFVGGQRLEVLRAHMAEAPPHPGQFKPGVDPELAAIALKLLAKAPEERLPTGEAVAEALGMAPPPGLGGRLLSPPLVGREEALGQLKAKLLEVGAGLPGGMTHLVGPAGVGKTRLLHALRSEAMLAGALVVEGLGGSQVPYAGIRDALSGLVRSAQVLEPASLKRWTSALIPILPELDPEGQAPTGEDPAREKARALEAANEVFALVAAHQSVVVLLDRWGASDAPSRELVAGWIRQASSLPAMVVSSSRELVERQAGEAELELGGLPASEAQRLLAAMMGQGAVPPEALEALLSLAEGNPAYLERALTHLVDTEILRHAEGAWQLARPVALELLPKGLHEALARKLGALGEDALEVARLVAVAGEVADVRLLAATTAWKADRLLAAVDALERARLLRREAKGKLTLPDGGVREVFDASLRPEDRTRRHAAIAKALEGRLAGTKLRRAPEALVSAAAEHYMRSGVPERIVTFGIEAGRRAAALFDAPRAERFLSAALAVLRAEGPGASDKPRLQALRLLADTKRLQGDVDGAMPLYWEAVPIATRLGANQYLTRIYTALADGALSKGHHTDALELCERAREVARAHDDKAGLARAHATAAGVLAMLGRLGEAELEAKAAAELGRNLDDAVVLGQAMSILGHAQVAAGRWHIHQGLAKLSEAMRLLEEVGDKVGLLNAATLQGAALHRVGTMPDAAKAFEKAGEVATGLGLQEDLAYALLNQSLVALDRGLYAQANGLAEASWKALDGLPEALTAPVRALALAFQAGAQAGLGRVAASYRLADRAQAILGNEAPPPLALRVDEHRLVLMVGLGRWKEAEATLARLQALLPQAESDAQARVEAHAALLAVRLHRLPEAKAALARASSAVAEAAAEAVALDVAIARARLALAEQRPAVAMREATLGLTAAIRLDVNPRAMELMSLAVEAALALGLTAEAGLFAEGLIDLGEHLANPLAAAMGRFGLAAAKPYGDQAKALVLQAQAALHAATVGLPAPEAEAFMAPEERQRILKGNHVGFGLKHSPEPGPQAPRPKGPTGPLGSGPMGLGGGLLGGM